MNPLLIGGLVLLLALKGKGGSKGGAAAKPLAQQLAADVTKRQYDYSRALAKRFQLAAGVKADGLYGPATKARVESYGVKAPRALFLASGAKSAKAKPVRAASRS